MKQSDNIANLTKALVAAQKKIQAGVMKNAQNATFDSTYADLGAMIDACKPALLEFGVVVVQSPTASGKSNEAALTTRLIHESGDWLEDTMTTPVQFLDPQGHGSAISYLRRYSLGAMMGLYQKDDDGEGASAGANGVRVGNERKPDATPATKKPVAAQAATKLSEDDPALKKKYDRWMGLIKAGGNDALATARANANSNFSGSYLDNILSAVEARQLELNAQAGAQAA
jgi:ERF superfamily